MTKRQQRGSSGRATPRAPRGSSAAGSRRRRGCQTFEAGSPRWVGVAATPRVPSPPRWVDDRTQVWEPFRPGSRWRQRWRDGPTCVEDAPLDPPRGGMSVEAPRPWRYEKLGVEAPGLVLRGGGEMNFSGIHLPLDEARRPSRIRTCASARSRSERGRDRSWPQDRRRALASPSGV